LQKAERTCREWLVLERRTRKREVGARRLKVRERGARAREVHVLERRARKGDDRAGKQAVGECLLSSVVWSPEVSCRLWSSCRLLSFGEGTRVERSEPREVGDIEGEWQRTILPLVGAATVFS